MNIQEAVKTLNARCSMLLYAAITDGGIVGERKPDLTHQVFDRFFFSTPERFTIRPSRDNPGLWYGAASRYHDHYACYFSEKPLSQLVTDIIEFYDDSSEFEQHPELVLMIMLCLSEKGFFVQQDKTRILGSVRMNFSASDFWLARFGKFYVAGEDRVVRGTIGCCRSYDTIIERLVAYYNMTDRSR